VFSYTLSLSKSLSKRRWVESEGVWFGLLEKFLFLPIALKLSLLDLVFNSESEKLNVKARNPKPEKVGAVFLKISVFTDFLDSRSILRLGQ
jgi:hypothetical protein